MPNWKLVNNKYIMEGQLYLSFDFLKTWHKELKKLNCKKVGGQYKYPESLIRFLHVLKAVFALGFRQEQGALKGLAKYVPIPNIISYSQIQRRTTELGLNIVKSLANPKHGQIIAVDASGIKLYNSGEWIRERHKKRKPFLKLHIAVNVKTKQAVAIEVTEDKVGDNKLGLKLVNKARKIKKVAKAIFDGAYDTEEIWEGLKKKGIKPVIRLRKNASPKGLNIRAREVRKLKKIGWDEWSKSHGYGQRWQAETWFSSYKRRFGEHCYSVKQENVLNEILFKACLCNMLIG